MFVASATSDQRHSESAESSLTATRIGRGLRMHLFTFFLFTGVV